MNRIHSLVWNRTLRVLQVASELTRASHGGSTTAGRRITTRRNSLALACLTALAIGAYAPLAWSGYNVTISTGTDTNTGTTPNFTATGTGSTVNAGEIGAALIGGSYVAVFTGSSGTEAGNIAVSSPITASGTGSLYLMAAGSIFANSSITGAGTGKPLNAYLWANYSGPAPGTPPYTYTGAGACATCTVIIGDSANGSIATYGGNVDIRTGDPAHIGGSVSIGSSTTGITGTIDTTDGTNPSGSLTVASTGISEMAGSGNYIHAGSATFDAGAGAINLGNGSNDFTGAVSLNNSGANDVMLSNGGNALVLGASSVGSGTLTASGVGISQTGAITQASGAGAATFNAGAGAITLGSANDFTGAVSLNNSGANTVTLSNGSNALVLGASNIGSGSLAVSGTGISQTGAITQAAGAGTATFDAEAGAIILANGGNDFTGAVSLNNSGANAVTLDNGTNALQLGTSSVGSGTLAVSGTGITQSGGITQAAGAGAATFNAGAGVLTLNQANDFTGAVSLNNSGANAVTLDNGTNPLQLGTSSVGSGTLTVNATGITETGAITQAAGAGAATFNAGAGVLTLNQANDFTGAVSLNNSGANAVTLGNGTNPLQLGTSSVGSGTLAVNATGITETGAITQATGAGAATFNAGAGAINLANSGNDFSGAVNLSNSGANNVAFSNGSNALTLGNVTVGSGTLNLSGTGLSQAVGTAITQAAGAGAVTLNGGAGAINLANSANDFTGAVTAIGAGVALTDRNDLSIASLVDGTNGAVSLIAGGNLNLPAGAINTGTADLTLAANGGTLASLGDLNGANVSLTGYDGLIFANAVTASGTLALDSASGAIAEGAAGVLYAATLTGNSAGASTFNGANQVATLGNFVANGFSLTNAQSLTVIGVVDGGAAGITLTTTGANHDLDINGTLGNVGGVATLSSAGAINEGAAGVVKAWTLAGSSTGITDLNGANQIATLGNFTASGFGLTNAQSLTVGGAINAGTGAAAINVTSGALTVDGAISGNGVELDGNGGLAINGAVNSGLGATVLTSESTISEGAGGMIAGKALSGSSTGATALDGANQITTLGNFVANGFSLTNAQVLTVAGAVDGGTTGTTLTTTTGDLAVDGVLGNIRGVTMLTSAGAISENAVGVLKASTLTGSSTGATALDGANQVATLGNFVANGFSLTNAQSLAVSGVVDGGTAGTTLTTTGANHDLDIDGTLGDVGGVATLTSAGAINENAVGALKASALTGRSSGATTLDGANQIATLGNFVANGFSLTNDAALAITGTLTSGMVTLNDASGIVVTGAIDATTTTIGAGTNLQVGDGIGNGSLTGDVTDNGALVFDRSDSVSFGGTISGTGSLTQQGRGTLTLAGANSYTGGTTIDGGTLQGDTTSLQGSIVDHAALVFAQDSDGILNGTLSGAGTLVKSGSGTLRLDGSNPFAGTTDVQAGTLIVGDDSHPGASLGGMVTVANDATLGGIGTIGGMDLLGTLSPGNSIGTLHVAGDAIFERGSTFQVEATSAGASDELAATGTVAIKGGNTLVIAQGSNWAPRTSYTIITANGGVSGQFTSISDNLVFLAPVLSYQTTSVELSLQRNDINFNTVTATPNENGVANGAEALGWNSPLYNALVVLDAPTARAAFDQLSGEFDASQQTARINDSRYVREAMDQRLREGAADSEAARLGDTKLTAWAHAWGHWATTDGDGIAARLSDNGDGLLIGADMPVGGQARIGVTGGASRDSVSVDSRASWGKFDSQWLGAFGGFDQGAFALRGGIAYARDHVPTQREVNFPGYSARLSGSAAGNTLTGFVEGAWTFELGRGDIAPFVNLAHARVDTDASTETGGAAALHAGQGSANVSFGTVGARGRWQVAHHFDLHGELGWQHAFGDTTPERTLQFVAGGPSFTEYGVPVSRNAGLGRIGLGWHDHNVAVDADYEELSGGGLNDQEAKLNVAVSF